VKLLKLQKLKRPLLVAALSTVFSSVAFGLSVQPDNNQSEFASLASKFLTTAMVSTTDKLVAVGDRGHVFVTKSQQWQQVIVPTRALLTNVTFVDNNNGWAVGHDATILHTADGGEHWSLQQALPALDRPLLSVAFSDSDHGVAVGAYGMYFATSDGGNTWSKQFLDSLLPIDDVEYLAEIKAESEEEYQFEIASILPHFNAISYLKDGRLMLVGELGLVAFSSDNGQSWQRLDNIYEGSFFASLETQTKSLLIGGLRGNMFRSVDGGKQWKKIVLDNDFSINHFSQLSNGDIFVAQNNGVILRSVDDGQTFLPVLSSKGQDMMSVVQFEQQIWLAGSKGLSKFKQEQ